MKNCNEFKGEYKMDLSKFYEWRDKCEKFIDEIYAQKISKGKAKQILAELKEEINQIPALYLPECFAKS